VATPYFPGMKFKQHFHPAIASQHYRMLDLQSRVASASPHGLVGLLYQELLRSLDLILLTHAKGKGIAGNAPLAKALSIILALEGSLNFADGGDLAPVLNRIYRSATRNLKEAANEDDIGKVEEVRVAIGDIAYAWQALSRD
jgi:flagellar secretion chaperone FliS